MTTNKKPFALHKNVESLEKDTTTENYDKETIHFLAEEGVLFTLGHQFGIPFLEFTEAQEKIDNSLAIYYTSSMEEYETIMEDQLSTFKDRLKDKTLFIVPYNEDGRKYRYFIGREEIDKPYYGYVIGKLDVSALNGAEPTYNLNGNTYPIKYNENGYFRIEVNEPPVSLASMFEELPYIQRLDFSHLDTFCTMDMNAFIMDTGLEYLNLGDMCLGNVTNALAIFNGIGWYSNARGTDINEFFSGKYDLSNVKLIDYGFCNNMLLKDVDLTPLNLVNCEDLRECFRTCYNLETVRCATDMPNNRYGIEGLDHFPNLRKVEITGYQVLNCRDSLFISNPNLEELILSGFDITKRGTYMGGVFAYCPKLHTLDISGWDFKNITRASPTGLSNWVYQSPKLENIIGPVYNIKVNLSVSANPLLTKESLMVLINGLAEVTVPRTITLGAVNKAKLTEEEIAIATNKGWTVA